MGKTTQRKPKVLIVLAHCDDEIIHGWPVYQNPNLARTLLICGSDEMNEKRPWGKEGKRTMLELAHKNGVGACAYSYDCEFYRLETRNGAFAIFYNAIANAVNSTEYDAIFTHNPHGEYGHIDHKLIFDIVFNNAKCPIWFTDIFTPSNWTKAKGISGRSRDMFYRKKLGHCVADEELIKKAEKLYRSRKCWTWDQPVVQECGLYEL